MTTLLTKTPKLYGNVQTSLETKKQQLGRTKKSESLPIIAGTAVGLQDGSFSIKQLENKTTKHFSNSGGTERRRKTVVSKSVQVSSEEENMYLSKIQALEKENLLLRESLKEKHAAILARTKELEDKTLQFQKAIEIEINSHGMTQKQLVDCQNMVAEKEKLLEESMQHHERVTREFQNQFEDSMASLQKQRLSEVNIRDEKIIKLKKQISELFKEKSWEHQQQLEEFQKELRQLAEEAQSLRIQVKRQDSLKTECKNCKSVMSELDETKIQLKVKNRTIEELQTTCQRLEKQLKQQEKLQNVLVNKNSRNLK